ncbi:RID1 [Scenedesmus sp. PABB004]|nr:RID1 [Scenedesmus sp. PABB004]
MDEAAGSLGGRRPHGRRRAPPAAEPFDAAEAAAKRARLAAERRALPMWGARAALLAEARAHATLVVVGETGSGKTTQIPQFLLEGGLAGRGGLIAVTQPRRVAAMSVAARVAQEMGVKLGAEVGYSIRFDDATSPATRIKYMTDGMLLREALIDPLLRQYDVVIVDEAHERSVHTDVLLGLLKQVQARRAAPGGGAEQPEQPAQHGGPQQQQQQQQQQQLPQQQQRRSGGHAAAHGRRRQDGACGALRLLVMSATLDAGAFLDYFGGSRGLSVAGRSHAVEVLYTAAPEDNYLDAALRAALQVHVDEPPGDVLVFLTGQEEIDSLARLLEERAAALPDGGRGGLGLAVLPIYAALPPEQQVKVFEPAPPGTRKVVLATNIAETSITIPGVRYVIDTGFVKARGYSARLGVDSLQVVPVSQAQARQRSGRAGRDAPGKAFRLYTEASFGALPAASPPEITRVNLGAVVLQLKALGVPDPAAFDFISPPPRAAVARSLELLLALGALDAAGDLTPHTGAALARLPVDPMFGKVLLAGAAAGCGLEAVQVVAMVSADNVFFNPRGKADAVAATRAKFVSPEGDQLTLLAVLRGFLAVERRRRAEWASDNYVNIRALRRALDIASQLAGHLEALGLPLKSCGSDPLPVARALTAGLFPHAARRRPDGTYTVLATGQVVALHPSSVLRGRAPEVVVFSELVRTTRHYAREVTRIQAAWLPELAPAFFAAKAAPGAGGAIGAKPAAALPPARAAAGR